MRGRHVTTNRCGLSLRNPLLAVAALTPSGYHSDRVRLTFADPGQYSSTVMGTTVEESMQAFFEAFNTGDVDAIL